MPGSVVCIRDIEGNQKCKGFTVMELTFHEEKTDTKHRTKWIGISDGDEFLEENETW